MKAGFPLPASDVSDMFEALGLDLPQLDRVEAQTPDQASCRGDRAGWSPPPGRSAEAGEVRYTVGGCMAEVTDVEVDGEPIRTIAIEAPDVFAVISAVHAMGLGGARQHQLPTWTGRGTR